ncbi:hypothetical protein L3Q82_026880 [Scortum barcoo]|uniref:Uncharacterized protein n=1 Tax=Scortum barcoo TaxID=214431 RepID=A0ACB8WLA6_9TELE|nr:hypothetical protein L3Q82_026880 [Scortum barcoo]
MRFFVLVVEHWTSSILSTGCLRVYGSMCALWIWRRHSTVSIVVFCGECSVSMGSAGAFAKGCSVSVLTWLRLEQELGPSACDWSGLQPSVKRLWDENQHLQIRGHGSRPEKGGVPSPGGWRGPASSGGVQVSRGLVHVHRVSALQLQCLSSSNIMGTEIEQ